jgi:hypothetical protein
MGLFDVVQFGVPPLRGAPTSYQTKSFPRPACDIYEVGHDGMIHNLSGANPVTFTGTLRIYARRGTEWWELGVEVRDGKVVATCGSVRNDDALSWRRPLT